MRYSIDEIANELFPEGDALEAFGMRLADEAREGETIRRRSSPRRLEARRRMLCRPTGHRPPGRRPRPRRRSIAVARRDGTLSPPAQDSENVYWAQRSLNQVLGLRLPVNGIMGAETRSAIRSFQQQNGIPPDGIIGTDTEHALREAQAGPSSGTPGGPSGEKGLSEWEAFEVPDNQRSDLEWEAEINRNSLDYIRWVQQSLNQILRLRLAVDGISGPKTRSAIRRFQKNKRLTVDGIVGPQTERALVSAGAVSPPSTTARGSGNAPSYIPVSSSAPGTSTNSCTARPNYQVWKTLSAFDFDRDTLKSAHHPEINAIKTRIVNSHGTSQPLRSLAFIGHSDPSGNPDYNCDLGLRRATKVAEALAEKLPPSIGSQIDLKVISRGEYEPLAGATNPALNRRVEVCLPGTIPKWFDTGGAPPMQPVRAFNAVQHLIGGSKTFKAMVSAIKTARSRDHYIYLLGWWLSIDFDLISGKRNSRMRNLFSRASKQGAQVRAMLWNNVLNQNSPEKNFINGALTNGAAILDSRVTNTWDGGGSHHQKILIVKGDEGLIAFCGGIDINPDRIRPTGSTPGSPFHDVHCRIKGPAAYDLLQIFLQRWQDHPDHAALDRSKGTLRGLSEQVPGPEGNVLVQVGRTYGNGARHGGVAGGYQFAPNGEQTCRRMILKAISEARRFIYIEDQYLVSMDISQALQAALRKIQHLIILIPHGSITDMGGQTHFRRREFIAPLRAAGGSKVGVFFLAPPGNAGTYVHSKMMVVDDEFAIIGSANLNRRSMTNDTEVTAGIFDPAGNPLAKNLRIALWAKHLGMSPSQGRANLANGVASVRYWHSPPANAHIRPYNENLNIEPLPKRTDAAWGMIDPDGS